MAEEPVAIGMDYERLQSALYDTCTRWSFSRVFTSGIIATGMLQTGVGNMVRIYPKSAIRFDHNRTRPQSSREPSADVPYHNLGRRQN